MSLKETREKQTSELERDLKDKQKHLYDLRSQGVTEKLEDPTQLGKARRQIAQLKTLLRERQIADEKSKAPATAAK